MIQAGAVILMLLGMLAKFAAVFVSIPEPIVGGVFMIMFGKYSFIILSIILTKFKMKCASLTLFYSYKET